MPNCTGNNIKRLIIEAKLTYSECLDVNRGFLHSFIVALVPLWLESVDRPLIADLSDDDVSEFNQFLQEYDLLVSFECIRRAFQEWQEIYTSKQDGFVDQEKFLRLCIRRYRHEGVEVLQRCRNNLFKLLGIKSHNYKPFWEE